MQSSIVSLLENMDFIFLHRYVKCSSNFQKRNPLPERWKIVSGECQFWFYRRIFFCLFFDLAFREMSLEPLHPQSLYWDTIPNFHLVTILIAPNLSFWPVFNQFLEKKNHFCCHHRSKVYIKFCSTIEFFNIEIIFWVWFFCLACWNAPKYFFIDSRSEKWSGA